MKILFQILIILFIFPCKGKGQDDYKPLLKYFIPDSTLFSTLEKLSSRNYEGRIIRGFSLDNEDKIKDFIKADRLDSIEYLYVYKNKNLSLDSIFRCKRLQKSLKGLYIEKTDSIPKSIGSLTNLRWLGINDSWITILPDEIGNLVNLETLNLGYPYKHFNRGNDLSELPPTISRLKKLNRLYLWGNSFEKLPEVICKLDNLEVLDISGNKLENISKCLLDLPKFKQINISGNNFKEIPEFLRKGNIFIIE